MQTGEFFLYYVQLCGYPSKETLKNVQGEMYKALERIKFRYHKREEGCKTYLIYDASFEKWLHDLDMYDEWRRLWNYSLYHGYHEENNVKWLLEQIPLKDFPQKAYVLGSGEGIRGWLPVLAERIQGIEFYLEFATKGTESLQEMLLEEYGMLSEMHLVAGGEFQKLRLRSDEPILILDFSGKRALSTWGIKRGSIWVDMDAVEEKRHLIEDRLTGIQYISLKKIWKREMLQTLDIMDKFAYNTEVKIGKL